METVIALILWWLLVAAIVIVGAAIHVPDHGDLIDKSGVEVLSWTDGEYGSTFEDGVLFALDKLDELPVIIPADGEDYEVHAEEHSPAYESIKRGLEQAINGEVREEET